MTMPMPDTPNDFERSVIVQGLEKDINPWIDVIRDRYTAYLTQFGFDEDKATHALIVYLQVGIEMGHFNEQAWTSLVAFMARRLSRLQTITARSYN